MENRIFYRNEWSTYHREKFIKPIIATSVLMLLSILATFNSVLLPFAILGIMGSGSALVLLSLLYFNRPSQSYDKKEYVYVQFKDNSLKLSLREDHLLIGDMKKYLIEEVKYPKIKYQIFEVPYNKIIAIKEHMSSNHNSRPHYTVYYESTALIQPYIIVYEEIFDSELRNYFAKLGQLYNFKTIFTNPVNI